MTKTEKRGLSLVLILLLVGGLYFVYRVTQTQRQAQDDTMAQAFADWIGASTSDVTGDDGDGTESGDGTVDGTAEGTASGDATADGMAEGTASGDGAPSEDAESVPTVGDGSGLVPAVTTDSAVTAALMAATEDATLSELLAQEDGVALELLLELELVDEASLPVLDGALLTMDELVAWMQTESLGAIGAQGDLTVAEAIALGIGAQEDAERRAFAKTQGAKNYQATMNLLEQQIVSLAYNLLIAEDTVSGKQTQITSLSALQKTMETTLVVYQAQLETAQTALSTAVGDTEALQEAVDTATAQVGYIQQDLLDCEAALAAVELELTQAQMNYEETQATLNIALGRGPTEPIVVDEPFTMASWTVTEVDTWVAQALAQRNELTGAAYELVQEKKALETLRYTYAPADPVILAQEAKVTGLEAAYLSLLNEVEAQVRSLYNQLSLSQQTIPAQELALAQAQAEATALSYAVGDYSSNYTTIAGAYASVSGQQTTLVTAIALYNQMVLTWGYAVSDGLETASI